MNNSDPYQDHTSLSIFLSGKDWNQNLEIALNDAEKHGWRISTGRSRRCSICTTSKTCGRCEIRAMVTFYHIASKRQVVRNLDSGDNETAALAFDEPSRLEQIQDILNKSAVYYALIGFVVFILYVFGIIAKIFFVGVI